jgi:hypothetical protein
MGPRKAGSTSKATRTSGSNMAQTFPSMHDPVGGWEAEHRAVVAKAQADGAAYDSALRRLKGQARVANRITDSDEARTRLGTMLGIYGVSVNDLVSLNRCLASHTRSERILRGDIPSRPVEATDTVAAHGK